MDFSGGTRNGLVTVHAGDADQTITGGGANLTENVTFGAGADNITTSAGNDTVTAGSGSDTIALGSGADTLP